MSPVITDSIPPICSRHRAEKRWGRGRRSAPRLGPHSGNSTDAHTQELHGVWGAECTLGKGCSGDAATGERGPGVDALSPGEDLPDGGGALRGPRNTVPCVATKAQLCWAFLSKCLSHKRGLVSLPGRTWPGHWPCPHRLSPPDSQYCRDGVSPTKPGQLGSLSALLCWDRLLQEVLIMGVTAKGCAHPVGR